MKIVLMVQGISHYGIYLWFLCNQRINNFVHFALHKDSFAYLKGKPTSVIS